MPEITQKRTAHNPEVAGSNPARATKKSRGRRADRPGLLPCSERRLPALLSGFLRVLRAQKFPEPLGQLQRSGICYTGNRSANASAQIPSAANHAPTTISTYPPQRLM